MDPLCNGLLCLRTLPQVLIQSQIGVGNGSSESTKVQIAEVIRDRRGHEPGGPHVNQG